MIPLDARCVRQTDVGLDWSEQISKKVRSFSLLKAALSLPVLFCHLIILQKMAGGIDRGFSRKRWDVLEERGRRLHAYAHTAWFPWGRRWEDWTLLALRPERNLRSAGDILSRCPVVPGRCTTSTTGYLPSSLRLAQSAEKTSNFPACAAPVSMTQPRLGLGTDLCQGAAD